MLIHTREKNRESWWIYYYFKYLYNAKNISC
jgi:hypothetical protein